MMNFLELYIFWRTYTPTETILTTKQVKIIMRKEFVVATLDLKKETYAI